MGLAEFSGPCECFNQGRSLCSPLRPSRRHFPRVMPLSKPGRKSVLLLLCPPVVPVLGAGSPSPGAPENVLQARVPKSPWHPFPQHLMDAKPLFSPPAERQGGRCPPWTAQLATQPRHPAGSPLRSGCQDPSCWGLAERLDLLCQWSATRMGVSPSITLSCLAATSECLPAVPACSVLTLLAVVCLTPSVSGKLTL